MPFDGYTQVAPDSTGKKIDMDVVTTAAGATLYREKAILVGETGDVLQQILECNLQQLVLLRTLVEMVMADHPGVGDGGYNDASTRY
jgi:hypothetical protein